MKTILMATDFSPAALNAARYASDMALSINANMILLYVFQLPVFYAEVPAGYTEEDMSQDAETELLRLKDELIQKTGGKLNIETEVRMGVFFAELTAVCDRIKPYTVVIGSQGTSAVQRLFFGGHAVYAMKHLRWPLITVPAGVVYSSVKKIGLACDFDLVLDTIPLDEIKALMNDFNAELYVLNTGKKEEFDSEIVFEASMLQEMLPQSRTHYNFIVNPDADEGILNFVEENNIDLLIVLPKRHSLLDKIIHKSHTRHLVLTSHVPVMAIH
jgi:nucleotide-binding universal stress UspA family protein